MKWLLYIHIPFCVKKCAYCDFVSFPGQEQRMEGYICSLLLEAESRRTCLLPEDKVATVYMGGGTPSLLPPALLRKLVIGLESIFPMDSVEEFTCEANPGTVTPEWLEEARRLGVNRLSLGVQAAQPAVLRTLGRIHTFEQAHDAVRLAREAGFANLSLDLMFGIPGQTRKDWRETVEAALSLCPEHISAYGLIPEEGTPLYNALSAGRLSLPEADEERAMYAEAVDTLAEEGYVQYEISNFARHGFACRHNIGYWRQTPYIGLGLAAASMIPAPRKDAGIAYTREKNPDDFRAYKALLRGDAPAARDTERVSPEEARFETLMLGLRMNGGVAEEAFLRMHGVSLEACYGPKLHQLAEKGLLEKVDHRWILTARGRDIQNSVLVELMD